MCDLIEKLFLDIKPEKINITLDEKEVMSHYDKDKDELLIMIGKLKAENYSLHQRLIGLDMFLKQVCGEFVNEMLEKKDTEDKEQKEINKINDELVNDGIDYFSNNSEPKE